MCIKSLKDNLIAVVFFDPENTNGSWFVGGIADKIVGFIIKIEDGYQFDDYSKETD